MSARPTVEGLSSVSSATALIVDDDPNVRRSLCELLESVGFATLEAGDGRTALDLIDREAIDVVLLDLELPRLSGTEVLQEVARREIDLAVVIVSGKGTVPTAVETMKLGAVDFIEKPADSRATLAAVHSAVRQVDERRTRTRSLAEGLERYGMVGVSPAMQAVYRVIDRSAPTRIRVLIHGASGTGKERVAKALHKRSTRSHGPFVAINCAAVPETMIEDELFGHVAHAFTGARGVRKGCFAQADGGTLFLDEVGDMSLMTQAKVLRVIETGEVRPIGSDTTQSVDVRILAATNKRLATEVSAGNFRDDLWFRLNVVSIHVPPLTQRLDDIELLSEHFITEACREHRVPPRRLSPPALQRLRGHSWPGNVRELKNVIERLCVLSDNEVLSARDVESALNAALEDPGRLQASTDGGSQDLREARNRFERDFILEVLESQDWQIGRTASALGIDRSHLWKKMQKLGIEDSGGESSAL